MKTPIIVYENGDLLIFESIKDAVVYLEPVDVENDEYTAFDSEGYNLKLRTDGNIVFIEKQDSKSSEYLHEILTEFLVYLGITAEWCATATLSELAEKGLNYKTK